MLNETIKHYDMEVDFFQKFLDPYMKYTSGLFESENDELEIATQRMLDAIIDSGKIRPGGRVLEIGPGWGALLKRLHERAIQCDYVGVSPSEVQNNYIRSFCDARARLVTSTFEDYEDKPGFDAIVLIGSFCHLQNKQLQLRRMKELLHRDGAIVIEDTFFVSKDTHVSHQDHEATRFVQEKIFGFAEILSLSEQIEQITNAGLKIAYMLEHSNSYKHTIGCWIRNLRQIDAAQYPNAKDFIKYMMIAQRGWNKTTQNHLLVLKRMN
jgi:Cyclopropane fatty acid synthase and related methyltransferases